MPSSLKYFCCACGGKETADYAFHSKAPKRKRNKSKLSSGSSTFTSKRLLDSEQNGSQSTGNHFQQMMFHTVSKDLSRETSFGSYDYHDSAAKLINSKTNNKRRKVQEIFPSESVQNNVSRTTFPWMDENFTPNSNSNVRLGVSSVHLHASRKLSGGSDSLQPEAIVNYNPDGQNNTDDDKLKDASTKHGYFKFGFRSHSVETPSDKTANKIRNASRSISLKEDKTVPSKHEAPKSDVKVKDIKRTQSGYKGDRKVPKLDDLKCLPATDVSHLAKPQRKPHTSEHNDSNNVDSQINKSECKSDVSFSSNVSHQTNRSAAFERSRQPKQPLTVVPKPVSHSHSKQSTSQPFPDTLPNNSGTRESMYGYIPKIVQSVQASNVLEGSKIDDFFMSIRNDNDLHSFASVEGFQTPRSQNQVTSPNVWRSRSVPHQGSCEHSVVKQTKSETDTDGRSVFEIQQFTIDFGSQDSLDTDSVFGGSNSVSKNSFRKKLLPERDSNEIQKHEQETAQPVEKEFSTQCSALLEIPFIDQEPDLIQGLKSLNVGDHVDKSNDTENGVADSIQPDKELIWEHTFSSQREYIESIPLKIPCPATPPLSRKGEALSVLGHKSNKNQAPTNYWMTNVDSEVLY